MKCYLLIALAVGLLTACQVPGNFGGNGSVRISLPSSASARGAPPNGSVDASARIQLVHNGVVVPLSGQNYLEQTLAGQTVTLDGLPTGKGFQVYVSIGIYPNGSGFFLVGLYRASDPFEISAGNSTAVSVTLLPSRVTPLEFVPGSVHSAAGNSGTLYYVSGPSISQITGDPLAPLTSTSIGFPSVTTYGLTFGYSGLWANTSQGIYISDGKGGWTPVSMGLSPTPVVQNSGDVQVAPSSTEISAYAGPGLSAGFNLGGGSSWVSDNIGLYGLAFAPGYVYASTGIGVLPLTSTLLAGLTSSTLLTYLSSSPAILQTEDGSPVGPVSTFSDGSTTAFGFAGTAKGLYAAQVDPVTGIPFGDGKLGLVSGTSGMNITTMTTSQSSAVYSYNSSLPFTIYTAAYSSTTREILILKNTSVVDRIEAFEGLPSGSLQLNWYAYYSGTLVYLVLVISGADGTVEVPMDSWVNVG